MNAEQIRRDFIAFADPRTLVEISESAVRWIQDRTPREALLGEEPDGSLRVTFEGTVYGYAQFFASSYMADLLRLAEELPRYLRELSGFVPANYVEPRVRVDVDEETKPGASAITQLCQAPDEEVLRTQLVFLRGRAGDGKTALLSNLAYQQANAFASGSATWIYFYVDAQGRSLARVDEAIALILQDLRARFTYHAVSALTRLGLIVPIIDGFDELLGAGGYRDAFASLGTLIERLDGRGALVASARSSFYNYTAYDQLARQSAWSERASYRIVPVELLRWERPDIEAYVEKRGLPHYLAATSSTDAVDELDTRLGGSADEILSSPFLLTRALDLFEESFPNEQVVDARWVVRAAVERFVDRELVEKILDTQGGRALSREQHLAVIGEVAEEMWSEETRELDLGTFRALVEMKCEDASLSTTIASKVVERLIGHALFSISENPPRISFRHELYAAFFLGGLFAAAISDSGRMRELIQRATITAPIADEFACAVGFGPTCEDVVRRSVETLNAIRPTPLKDHLLRRNRGSLFAALIRRYGPDRTAGQRFVGAQFDGELFSKSRLTNAIFENCEFLGCDFDECSWSEVNLLRSRLAMARLSLRSTFKVDGLAVPGDVYSIDWIGKDGTMLELFDPDAIAAVLRSVGAVLKSDAKIEKSDRAREVADELGRLLRVVRSTIIFSEDDFNNRGYSPAELQNAWRLLEKHGLVVATRRSMQGSRKLYKLTVPATDVLAGEARKTGIESVDNLWAEVVAL